MKNLYEKSITKDLHFDDDENTIHGKEDDILPLMVDKVNEYDLNYIH